MKKIVISAILGILISLPGVAIGGEDSAIVYPAAVFPFQERGAGV